jgi:hypothetical protein
MAGSGRLTLTPGCVTGCADGAGTLVGEFIPSEVQKGYGTPTHPAPVGTIYVKMDATMGTSSHYRCTAATGTWAPMSDD